MSGFGCDTLPFTRTVELSYIGEASPATTPLIYEAAASDTTSATSAGLAPGVSHATNSSHGLSKGDIAGVVVGVVAFVVLVVIAVWKRRQVGWVLTCGCCASRNAGRPTEGMNISGNRLSVFRINTPGEGDQNANSSVEGYQGRRDVSELAGKQMGVSELATGAVHPAVANEHGYQGRRGVSELM